MDIKRDDKIKFEDFSQEYLNTHSKQHKKSWVTDSYHVADFNLFFKSMHLSEITAQDIEHFKMERQKDVSKSTVNRQMGLLRGMLNKAVAWGKLHENPMKSVRFLPEPEGRLRFLEKDQIKILIENCSPRLRSIVIVALYTGMRRGEILNLQWQAIDFKRNVITLLETKNGKSRKVPMNALIQKTLQDLERNPHGPYVFCFENGERIQDVRKSFSSALKKSKIADFHFHDLRHTFASQLVMAGVDLFVVKELMGHKDMKMTLRYAHLAPSHKHRAVEALAEAIDTVMTPEAPEEEQAENEASQPLENKLVTRVLEASLN